MRVRVAANNALSSPCCTFAGESGHCLARSGGNHSARQFQIGIIASPKREKKLHYYRDQCTCEENANAHHPLSVTPACRIGPQNILATATVPIYNIQKSLRRLGHRITTTIPDKREKKHHRKGSEAPICSYSKTVPFLVFARLLPSPSLAPSLRWSHPIPPLG